MHVPLRIPDTRLTITPDSEFLTARTIGIAPATAIGLTTLYFAGWALLRPQSLGQAMRVSTTHAHLLGYRDNALIDGAISPSAQRNASQIAQHINDTLTRFDVDGDGQTLALTDGVMILRRLLGITQLAAITQGVKNSARSDADVVLVIDALKP